MADEIDASVDRILRSTDRRRASAMAHEMAMVMVDYTQGEQVVTLLAAITELIHRSPDPSLMFQILARTMRRFYEARMDEDDVAVGTMQ